MAKINREIISGNNTYVKTLVDDPSSQLEGFPLGVRYIVATEQVVNPETGKREYTNRQIAYYDSQAKIYKQRDKHASVWFILDLETGDTWNPADDAELQEYLVRRGELDPVNDYEAWHNWDNLIKRIYQKHANDAFIRKK